MDLLPHKTAQASTDVLPAKKPLNFHFAIIVGSFIFIAAVALVFSAILFFKQPHVKDIEPFTKVIFADASLADAYAKFIEQGIGGDYEAVNKAFIILNIDYKNSPTGEKREMLHKIAQYAQDNFKDKYEPGRFVLSCLDKRCPNFGKFYGSYSNLKLDIQNNQYIDSATKKSLLASVDFASQAALNGNKRVQFTQLSSIFFLTRDLWKSTGAESLKVLAGDILENMRQIDPENYGPILDKQEIFKI